MKTWRRPMGAWWTRNPYYLWYMLREASCVFITAYALILLWGLVRLRQGEGPFDGWLAALGSPASIAFHAAAALLVLYHAWTWFRIMPKTLPRLPVPDRAVVALGLGASVLLSGALLWIAL